MAAGHLIVSALLAVIALSSSVNALIPGAVGGFFGAGHPIGTSYSAISHGGPVGAWGHGFGYGLGGLYGGYGLGGHTVSHVSHGPVGLGYGGLYGHYGGYGLGGVYGHGLGGYYGHGLGGVYGHGYGLGGGYGHGYGLGGIYGHYGGYGLGGVYSHYGVGSRTVNHVSHRYHPLGYGITYPIGHAVHRVTQPIAHHGTISRRYAIPHYEVRYVSYPVVQRYVQMVTVNQPYIVPRYETHIRSYQVPVPRYQVHMAQYPVVIPRLHIAESHHPVTHYSQVSHDVHQPIYGVHYPMGHTVQAVSHQVPYVYGSTHAYGGFM
uniref:Suckerin-6 n=1 Tax=Sepioteuthis lessoniana TaxID=34570 RepID=A0A081DU90_SEPLE|nr:suckerin-6 [Sepioteuthis lessoniana]